MNTYYKVDGWIKFTEVDNYQEGCDPSTTQGQSGKMKLYQWHAINADGEVVKTILTSVKDIKIASAKIMKYFGANGYFLSIRFNGIVER